MYEKPRVNVKVERGSTFTFTRGFSCITSILIFTHVKPVKDYVRTHVKITRQWKSTFRIETVLCFYCAVVCLVVWRLATNTRIVGTIVAWSEALHVPNEQEMSSLLFTEGKPLSLKICVKILNNQTILVNRVVHSKANCLVLPIVISQ